MNNKSFIHRLYEYQKERFPVIQYIIYIFLFYYGFFNVNLYLSHLHIHYTLLSLVGFITIFLIFFQLRLLDEIKDYKIDSEFMPERPIQRGLVSLKEIKVLLAFITSTIIIINLFFGVSNLLYLLGMEFYILLMAKEFFIGESLRKNRVIYASLHMVVMALIALYISNQTPGIKRPAYPYYLLPFISYLLGFIVEIGRKIVAPGNEREGVDTYSKLLGPRGASLLLLSLSILSSLCAFSIYIRSSIILSLLSLILIIIVILGVAQFLKNMRERNANLMNFSAILYSMGIFIIFILSHYR